jgi:cation:H+ antiporter
VLAHTGIFFSVGIFLGGLALISLSSLVLSTSLERMGVRFHFTQALLGIVTALGADAPEISSALTAMQSGNDAMGVGIVFGSNLFNMASLLGLSAVAAGCVKIGTQAVVFNGAVAMIVAVGAGLIALAVIPAWSGLAILGGVFIPYVVLCALGPQRLRWCTVPAVAGFLEDALAEERAGEPTDAQSERPATAFDMLSAVPALVSVILGSVGMVRGAQALGHHFGISDIIVGTIVLAALTGVPNVIAAVRLARKQQGAAVISEAFNSNSLNIAVAIFIPAMLVGIGTGGAEGRIAAYWLIGLTAVGIALTLRKGGLQRNEGWALIAGYAAFVALLAVLYR